MQLKKILPLPHLFLSSHTQLRLKVNVKEQTAKISNDSFKILISSRRVITLGLNTL